MAKTNQDFIGKQCIGTADAVSVVKYESKKIHWKSFHEKILKT